MIKIRHNLIRNQIQIDELTFAIAILTYVFSY